MYMYISGAVWLHAFLGSLIEHEILLGQTLQEERDQAIAISQIWYRGRLVYTWHSAQK